MMKVTVTAFEDEELSRWLINVVEEQSPGFLCLLAEASRDGRQSGRICHSPACAYPSEKGAHRFPAGRNSWRKASGGRNRSFSKIQTHAWG